MINMGQRLNSRVSMLIPLRKRGSLLAEGTLLGLRISLQHFLKEEVQIYLSISLGQLLAGECDLEVLMSEFEGMISKLP